MPKVAVVMGSDSDLPVLREGIVLLKSLEVEVVAHALSAHRTPDLAVAFAQGAEGDGIEIIIAAAGMAAHLAGVMAAHTPLPVIGVPVGAGALAGEDALLSTVMMPPGVPVAAVGIDGGLNAALLAVQMLGVKYPHLREAVRVYKQELAKKVAAKDEKLAAAVALL